MQLEVANMQTEVHCKYCLRQAVSKWENDCGYPEVEKLIQIAQKLDVSLDALMLDQQLIDNSGNNPKNGNVVSPIHRSIVVLAKDGKEIGAFYKFRISTILSAKKGAQVLDLRYEPKQLFRR